MLEEWRAITGYEGLYEVSDLGRVKSLARTASTYFGVRTVPERILKNKVRKDGYLMVNPSKDNRVESRLVHQLVLEAFSGPRLDGLVARHLDGNRENNQCNNLAWGTQEENMQDTLRHGTNHNANKSHCKRGHPFDEENTRIETDGNRACRACDRTPERRESNARNARARRARKKAAAAHQWDCQNQAGPTQQY